MHKIAKLSFGMLIFLTMCCACGGCGQIKKTAHKKVILDSKALPNSSFIKAFESYVWIRKIEEIAKIHHISCGIEESPFDPFDHIGENLDLNYQQATIRDVLNEIVKKHPTYTWKYAKSILNIIPKSKKEYIINGKPFSKYKLNQFTIGKDIPKSYVVLFMLQNAGIITTEISIVMPIPLIGGNESYDSKTVQLKSMVFENTTVRKALNKLLAIDNNTAMWKLYYDDDKNLKDYTVEYLMWP